MGRTARRTRDATTGLSGGTGTDQGKTLVGGGSYRDHRGRDCCGHAAVKSGGRDGRGGHTEEQGASCAGGSRRLLPLHIFDAVITGHQAGWMFGDMEPAFLGAGKQAYLMSARFSTYGIKRECVQSKRFVHQCATIAAIEGSRYRSHGSYVL